ncbi:hypothetical protein NM208_g436 [Fusarium decemcellulare]|uniref:Uncharacterized protein n=1 Tax=Fusarium decemcellulare TaxID=57161 RepID=A0ACC1SZS8_9HYPO|nr:hypothetical protein NM208_g436 [Fusarium decemcellulare]
MGNTQSTQTIVPQISSETISKGIPHRLCMTFAKRATLKLECLLSEPNAVPAFAVQRPHLGYYDILLYDGPNPACPVLATAKRHGKLPQDYCIGLPPRTSEDTTSERQELLRCSTIQSKTERYWFAMRIGEGQDIERFEWRWSHCDKVKSLGGATWGWKLVRFDVKPEEVGEDDDMGAGEIGLPPEGTASDGGEVVAVWADDKSLSLSKIGELCFLGSGTTGGVGSRLGGDGCNDRCVYLVSTEVGEITVLPTSLASEWLAYDVTKISSKATISLAPASFVGQDSKSLGSTLAEDPMGGVILITVTSSAFALLSGVASAASDSDRVETICGKQRFGEFNDSLMYYPNAWNKKSPKDGFVCMKVDNSTPSFDATWNWEKNIEDVHSFPYVRFGHEDLPMRLSNLKSIRLSTEWMYTRGNPSKIPRDFSNAVWAENKAELQGGKVQANAAWDFFLDDDRNRPLYPQVAAIEFMVWLGRVGDPWWLGRQENTILSNVTLGETEFSLYYGRNSGGTHVFTAVTRNGEDVLSLDEDFYPLFEYILEQAHKHTATPDDLPKDPWLGIVEFGTETWLSDGNVTFTAANYGMKLNGTKETEDDGNSSNADSTGGGQNSDGGGNADKTDSSDPSDSTGSDEEDHAAALMDRSVLRYTLTVALPFPYTPTSAESDLQLVYLMSEIYLDWLKATPLFNLVIMYHDVCGKITTSPEDHYRQLPVVGGVTVEMAACPLIEREFLSFDSINQLILTRFSLPETMPETPVASEGRLRRALFALPMLGLSAIMTRAFAMGEPIAPEFYRIPILDEIFAHITVAFAQLQFFTDQKAYWHSLVFLTDFAGMYAVGLIESYRPANKFPALRFPVIYMFLSQLLGIGFLAPIYFYLFYVFTPAYKLTTPSLHLPGSAPCMALLPTIVLAYFSSHFPSYFHPSLEARNWWNWIWQLFPIWGSFTMLALSKVIAAMGKQPPNTNNPDSSDQELRILRVTVYAIALVSTVTWWCTFSNLEVPISEIFVPQYFVKSPQAPDVCLRTILQYDYICTYTAGILWLAYHFSDLEKAGVCNIPWIRGLCVAGVVDWYEKSEKQRRYCLWLIQQTAAALVAWCVTVRYNVATALDGFIASLDGTADWIVEDSSIDFDSLYAEFDFFVMGRKTYEVMLSFGAPNENPLTKRAKESVLVASRTMKAEDFPDITIISDNVVDSIRNLKSGNGKDIWLMGGSDLATQCLRAGLIDSVEAAVMPVMLGSGIKMIEELGSNEKSAVRLKLEGSEYLQSGIIMTRYSTIKPE